MAIKIVERPELGALVSPHGNQHIPIHNWYSYKHGYSRDLAVYLIKNFGLSQDSWVLDPFCGGGTTLLTCKELGINAHGYDILPFSVFLSNVKVSDYDVNSLERQLNVFTVMKWERNGFDMGQLPDIPLVRKAFSPEIGERLLALKHAIDCIADKKVKSLFNLAFLNILESVSNTSKAGGFLRIVNRDVKPDVIRTLFMNKLKSMVRDVTDNENTKRNPRVTVKAETGDARKLSTKRKYDAVITSPPYPNRHDYTRIYSLEMIFDFVSNNNELKKLRYETLRSHVEARKKYEAPNYEKPALLDGLISKVKSNGTNNPQVIGMLEGYFEDMHLCLSEIYRCLKVGGRAALVVSNVRFAGVSIPVDEILADVGTQVGLTPKDILVARYRGNSSQQMRDYSRMASRESIVIWERET